MTIYDIKPQFQNLLRPVVKTLADRGITANQVTLTAAVVSILVGAVTYIYAEHRAIFLLLPIWLFLRMALNAVDGMLAREFNQKSNLGHFLNELGDIVSDVAFLLPFSLVAPFSANMVLLIILLAILSEIAGILSMTIGASRRYDGPLGKSDRAFVFSVLALWIGFGGPTPAWLYWLLPVIALLIALTIVNRIKAALSEV